MKISAVSVKRPVFAAVISLMLVILGLLSASRLAVRELPDVEAAIVSIDTNYLGAAADVVETKITQVIEERVAGLEGITKITSQSTDGRSSINLEFDPGRSVDEAANDVRDRVARVADDLPPEADPPEVGKVDFGADPIIWLALSSDTMNVLELTDYAERELVDRFSVLPGVARVRMGGARRYAMRVWIDREALAARQLTVADVEASLRRENVQLPAGRLESSQRELTLRTETGLNTEQEFRDLVIGRGAGGYLVRLGEVADVRLAAENERTISRTNGVPGISIGIEQISKANTLEVARAVRAERERIVPDLPAGTRLEVNLDRSVYIEASMMEVVKALLIAMALVIAVIYLFLGNLRATLVPAVTIPVSIIAAFIVMGALGFSINTLTLLGLVLAIGLVVDDAIVVLENIYRRMENGEPALIASVDGSREIGFAVVATTIVLVAVFLPMSFLSGNVGKLFREFGFTIAAAVAFSSLVALTLTPMMTSKLFAGGAHRSRMAVAVDDFFQRLSAWYDRNLRRAMRRPWLVIGGTIAATAMAAVLLKVLPSELAPVEDRGFVFIGMNGPEGSSLEYMDRHVRILEGMAAKQMEIGRRVARQHTRTGRLWRLGQPGERSARLPAAGALGRARTHGGPDRAVAARTAQCGAGRARLRDGAGRVRRRRRAGAGRAAGNRVRRPRAVARPADAAHGREPGPHQHPVELRRAQAATQCRGGSQSRGRSRRLVADGVAHARNRARLAHRHDVHRP